jgi:serine/threonine protein phosphatase PrpC
VTDVRFDYIARTDKGLVRAANEDAFGTMPDDGMVVVADGMGGYKAGEVASQLTVDTFLRYLNRNLTEQTPADECLEYLCKSVEQANLAIWRASDEAPELRGMGTTIVAALFRGRHMHYVWVGDSRLYRLRDGALQLLTSDHTLVQELVNQGLFASVAQAVASGVGDNVLTRALGADQTTPADTGSALVKPGDVYLFCSDGLNHMVEDPVMEAALTDEGMTLDEKADQLVRLACDAGGRDNITLVLVGAVALDDA